MAFSDPVSRVVSVVPHDTNPLTISTSTVIYVGVAGDLSVVTDGGDTVVIKNAPVGWHPIRVSRVRATGTTAQQILAGR